ncbi:toxin-antitoxin system toxin subunit [Bifidobacterium simiarum]|uniref:Toxin-antitoxin system toxin subunit n=1 Tax=Bifidobacterium simiarum TaxID=2045441 RepID=A0A2M9HGK6_9BIFI|nr:toxin-antitoxin system toxin subunit [Bifidobacterium simiarum]
MRYRDRDTEPPRWATIGFDAEGRGIELVFVRLDDYTPLIIHANYLTKGFRDEVRRSR